jgi:hypothetical protein
VIRDTQIAALGRELPDCRLRDEHRFCPVRMFGVTAWLTVSINTSEWRRRERYGLGALTGLEVLDGLLGLPLGLPVPTEALTARERQLVRRVPHSVVVQCADATVIRRAEPVLECSLAVVFARSWSAGLADASKFAPFCQRLTVLESCLAEEMEACLEASYYGVGLLARTENKHVMLVPPEPLIGRRVTAAGWWFTEETYRQIRAAG